MLFMKKSLNELMKNEKSRMNPLVFKPCVYISASAYMIRH